MRVKALREAKGWTQGQLAKAAGLHQVTIAKYETGVIGMSLDSAVKLAAALNCTVDKVAGVEDDKGQGGDMVTCDQALRDSVTQMLRVVQQVAKDADVCDVLKLDDIPTHKLVAELRTREGVSTQEIEPYKPYKVEGEGPAIILIVED